MFISFVTLLVWRDFVFSRRKFLTGPSSNRSELVRVGPALEMRETDPNLFAEPVSSKLIQGFVWGAVRSRAGLTSCRSHVYGVFG